MLHDIRLEVERSRGRSPSRSAVRGRPRVLLVLLLALAATVATAPHGVADVNKPPLAAAPAKATPKATKNPAKNPAKKKVPAPAAEGTNLSRSYTNPLLSPPLLPVENLRMALYENLKTDKDSAFEQIRNGAVVYLNPLMLTAKQLDELTSYTANFGGRGAWAASVAMLDPLKSYLSPGLVDELTAKGYPHLMTLAALNVPSGKGNSEVDDPGKAHSEVVLQTLLDELGIPWQAIALAGSERQQCGACAPLYHPETPLVYGRPYDLNATEVARQQKDIAAARQKVAAEGTAAQNKAQRAVEKKYTRLRNARNGRALDELSTDLTGVRAEMDKLPDDRPRRLFVAPSQSPCRKAGAQGQFGPARGGAAPPAFAPAAAVVEAGPCDEADEDSAGSQHTTGLGPALTQPGMANGGIDFSTLELRYLADPGDGSGLQYSFSAGLDPLKGDNRQSTGITAATESSDAFFVWLELNPSAFWVNLNPTEPNRIVDAELGRTDAGRIMLEADLGMKRSIGKLIHPDTALGKQFWGRMAGNCMSYRTWIVPEPAKVYQDGDKLYILDAPLDVEMETQYLKVHGSTAAASCPKQDKATESHNEQLFRSLVLPKLKNQINTAPVYADLRRVYLARVAAEWYRRLSRDQHTAYGDLVDKGDVDDWTTATRWKPTDTFHDYVDSYTKGEFNVTRKTTEGDTVLTHTYVYGGVDLTKVPFQQVSGSSFKAHYAQLPRSVGDSLTKPTAHGGSHTVFLGAPTPKQVSAASSHHGISVRSFTPVIRVLPELVLLVLVLVYRRRRRLAAAGPAGPSARFRRATRTSSAPRTGLLTRIRLRPGTRSGPSTQAPGQEQAGSKRAGPKPAGPKPTGPKPAAARPIGPIPETPTPADPPAAGGYTLEHVSRVVRHLARPELDRFAPNDAMVAGIRQALTTGRPLSEGEVNFLRHQLTEAALMDAGQAPEDAYEAALRTHPAARNYTPEVIGRFPELFNNAWRRAWGMDPR
ncbi:hypothetical protein [Streptomyces sp. NBC_00448]|uniref:hypothetical protein n=1 Tax=Streptomyces sp. NBC_00448 TaxID=2903652 RepID=UPI002E1C5ABE